MSEEEQKEDTPVEEKPQEKAEKKEETAEKTEPEAKGDSNRRMRIPRRKRKRKPQLICWEQTLSKSKCERLRAVKTFLPAFASLWRLSTTPRYPFRI